MVDLTPDSQGAEGHGINDKGEVVGGFYQPSGLLPQHAFLYSNGVVTDLGTLGGLSSRANAINASGQVTGFASIGENLAPGNDANHAYIYSNGAMVDLGTLGGRDSGGASINSQGQVVGSSAVVGSKIGRAFLYAGGTMYDLNTLVVSGLGGGTLTGTVAINDAGQILAVGCNITADSCTSAQLTYILDPDPDQPGGGGGCASTGVFQPGPIDPTLPLLLMLALIGICLPERFWRRR